MEYVMGSKNTRDVSPETQESNDTGRSKAPKTDKTIRIWSVREEEIIRVALKELVALGWKSDNGFQPGYLNKLEDAIRREFPDTDLKVHPNIVSKLTAWKKNYYSLQAILSRSGVGFNLKGDYMIDCDNDQWEQIVKVDANARFMRNKSWPYWDDWKEIFGKDRANGLNAEDILDAVNDLYSQDNLGNVGAGVDGNVSLEVVFVNDPVDDNMQNDGAEASVCQGGKKHNNHTSRKRKADDGIESIFKILNMIHADTNARLEGCPQGSATMWI